MADNRHVIQTDTVSSADITGTPLAPVLTPTGIVAGSYNQVTVDSKGRVTAGLNPAQAVDFALNFFLMGG